LLSPAERVVGTCLGHGHAWKINHFTRARIAPSRFHSKYTDTGKPHIIKEENYLLFGVVEEKAQKSESCTITFDFWTIRRHVLYDRFTNAAVVLQSVVRAHLEQRRKRAAPAWLNALQAIRSGSSPHMQPLQMAANDNLGPQT
jgi:hypothetical protein